ncbi:gliding motility lipoprotein GldH [Polaribacter sp. HL-MS24]|uniref:gliding motility lipoprotein GldH n=1 Tax=Polaribacter sp. HL-MS24 TaxID=3077735 RepID=UPI0029344445|nr:gliding motility lipoprotein GldH [Polaribacter sp. HL-MS24]WOC41251.1 gliding motility lipoprotein GldH [Polaribacter sp. HL-MS24]
MKTIQKKNKVLSLLILLLVAFSCSSDVVYTSYTAVENNSWDTHKKITFNFSITDTISKQNVFINIRNNNAYKYSNLFLITELVFPNNTRVIDTLEYEMADRRGKFLGKGFTETKENKLFYKEEKIFPISGAYSFHVRQAMRKNGRTEGVKTLEGILSVGLSIEKIK